MFVFPLQRTIVTTEVVRAFTAMMNMNSRLDVRIFCGGIAINIQFV